MSASRNQKTDKSNLYTGIAARAIAIVMLGSGIAGCGGAMDAGAAGAEGAPAGTEQQQLYGAKRYWPRSADGIARVPVCWVDAGYDADKQYVRSAIEGGWQAVAALEFTGWGTCTAADMSARVLRISLDDTTPHSGVGPYSDGVDMVLNFTYSKWNSYTNVNCHCPKADPKCVFTAPSCDYCSDNHEFCNGLIGLHEFGHALGFYHEQVRPENADKHLCNQWQDGETTVRDGDPLTSSYDKLSIMNYCSQWDRQSASLSDGDMIGAFTAYGARPSHLGHQVLLYKDSFYGGLSQALYDGDYNVGDLKIGNDALSSLRVSAGFSVTLYDDKDFGGHSVTLTSDNPRLDGISWNDRVSSIRVHGPALAQPVVYADAKYAGRSQALRPGVYNVNDLTVGNDTISSVRVPGGFTVTLHETRDFYGNWEAFTGDIADLGPRNFNDRTSSIVVQGPADQSPVIVFADNGFAGAAQALWPGRYDVSSLTVGNDAISSVIVPTGWKVVLYKDSGFQGDARGYTANNGELWRAGFNQVASSVIVEGP